MIIKVHAFYNIANRQGHFLTKYFSIIVIHMLERLYTIPRKKHLQYKVDGIYPLCLLTMYKKYDNVLINIFAYFLTRIFILVNAVTHMHFTALDLSKLIFFIWNRIGTVPNRFNMFCDIQKRNRKITGNYVNLIIFSTVVDLLLT